MGARFDIEQSDHDNLVLERNLARDREREPRRVVARLPAPPAKQWAFGDRVKLWTGEVGRVTYHAGDWVGVQVDGELHVHSWQAWQIEAVK